MFGKSKTISGFGLEFRPLRRIWHEVCNSNGSDGKEIKRDKLWDRAGMMNCNAIVPLDRMFRLWIDLSARNFLSLVYYLVQSVPRLTSVV